ncbi:uncharacterized protein LOC125036995 [Penaeus chinensis]|uniref:uncharacterized protein LOC125036995 n=1 Tax=Penaeus chinensis TaxID=139456 RepID=UPI001FB6ED60|nr:uncharacterized protein LOC125036995 [Penaeus chinensis]
MCHLEHRHNDWKKQGDSRDHEAGKSENTLCARSIREIPEEEGIILGADLNCHVGETAGYGPRNEEGERMVETLESLEQVLVNTGFKKRDEHLTTYRSRDSSSQIDFLVENTEGKWERDEGRDSSRNVKALKEATVEVAGKLCGRTSGRRAGEREI